MEQVNNHRPSSSEVQRRCRSRFAETRSNRPLTPRYIFASHRPTRPLIQPQCDCFCHIQPAPLPLPSPRLLPLPPSSRPIPCDNNHELSDQGPSIDHRMDNPDRFFVSTRPRSATGNVLLRPSPPAPLSLYETEDEEDRVDAADHSHGHQSFYDSHFRFEVEAED